MTPLWIVVLLSLLVPLEAQSNCTICSGGVTANLSIPECQGYEHDASLLPPPPDPGCLTLQLQGFVQCGCPTAPANGTCTVCPDGSNVNGSIRIPGGNYTSCQQLATVASFVPVESDLCTNYFQAHAAWCGCQDATPSCPLCPDGSPVPDPNFTFPGLGGAIATCAFFDYTAQISGASSEEDCQQARVTAFACGCPGVKPNCTLCANGDPPPLSATSPAGIACDILELVATLSATDQACVDFQQLGWQTCGCEGSNTPTGVPTLAPAMEPLTPQPIMITSGAQRWTLFLRMTKLVVLTIVGQHF